MAKKVGQVNESTGRVETRNVRRAKTGAIPWTVYDTKAKRAWRNLVG